MKTAAKPRLAILIVSWNTRTLLEELLASVTELPDTVVAVADNDSTDGTPEMVRERFPQVQLTANSENLGFTAAANQLLRSTDARYLLLLNPDCQVSSKALGTLAAFMDSHSRCAACGPKIRDLDGSLERSACAFPSPRRELLARSALTKMWPLRRIVTGRWSSIHEPQSVDLVSGACLLIRDEASDSVGLLDEDYLMYGQETDWCFRAKRLGWEIYLVPQAEIVHLGKQSSKQVPRQMSILQCKDRWMFYVKHRTRFDRLLLAAIMTLEHALKLTAHSLSWVFQKGEARETTREKMEMFANTLRYIPTLPFQRESRSG